MLTTDQAKRTSGVTARAANTSEVLFWCGVRADRVGVDHPAPGRSKLLETQPPEDVGAILELHQGKGFVFGELFEMLSLDGKPLHQPQREVTRTCATSQSA